MTQLPRRVPEAQLSGRKFPRPSVEVVAAVADAVKWWAERDRLASAPTRLA